MTYTINGQIRYDFDDLAERYGYTIAKLVFADIISTCSSWIVPETGETGSMPPERVNEGALFDEVGWSDLCRHAEEIARRNPGTRHLGDGIYQLHKAVSSWGRPDESPSD